MTYRYVLNLFIHSATPLPENFGMKLFIELHTLAFVVYFDYYYVTT